MFEFTVVTISSQLLRCVEGERKKVGNRCDAHTSHHLSCADEGF